MPDGSPVNRSNGSASDELGLWLLETLPGARVLGSGELSGYSSYRPVAGWRLTLSTKNAGRRTFDLLVDSRFPESVPVVILRDRPALNVWPHVEADGRLCIGGEGQRPIGGSAAELGRSVLRMARALVDDSASGNNRDDLRAEALSYWAQTLSTGSPSFLSLLNANGPTRGIVCCLLKGRFVVAEDEAALRTWLGHALAGKADKVETFPGALAWLPQPPIPAEYPAKLADVERLLAQQAPEATSLLQAANANLPDHFPIVLGSPTLNGPCLMAVLVGRGAHPRKPLHDKTKLVLPGFRPGRAPPHVVARHWRGFATLQRASVHRVDPSWIHGRDTDRRVASLRDKTVVFVGCGSVGSPLIERMASAGVGNLVLIDPERLTGANVGRHELGADDLFERKAEALARSVRRRYPHLRSVRAVCTRWQEAAEADQELFERCDLIVSSLGVWADEWELNRWQVRAGRMTPIVYAWTEPNAAAGHAVHIGRSGGCFACGFGSGGTFEGAVTEWPKGRSVLPEPACGGSFVEFHQELTRLPAKFSLRTDPCFDLTSAVFSWGHRSDLHGVAERDPPLGVSRPAID